MSDSNAPENVDLDEKFNQLDPAFLERALRLNLTSTIRQVAIKSAERTMPLMLMGVMGVKPTVAELEIALTEAYTALAVTVELSKLIDELAPFKDVDDMPAERRDEIKALISAHPMIKKAVRVIKELMAELNGR